MPALITVAEAEPIEGSAADETAEMPLPHDPVTVFLGGLFLIATFAALYVARDIAMPVILAVVLKLLLQPAIRMLEQIHLPRVLSVLICIGLLFGVLGGITMAIAGPGGGWAAKLPDSLPRLQQHLSIVAEPVSALRRALKNAEQTVQSDAPAATDKARRPAHPTRNPPAATADQSGPASHESIVLGALFTTTANVVTAIGTTMLVLFFLLLSGDTFLRRLVEILPGFRVKRQAVDISQQVERNISAYLLTITLLNAAVGVATGVIMWATGVGDPLLWGTVAFLLNYMPILGPMIAMVVFMMAGFLMFDSLGQAILPPALYFCVHLIEGEIVEPLVLAKRFTLNPVLVVLSLIFWFWMWGVAGAILAVPMLAILKMICDGVRPLAAFGHFLEG